MSEHDFSQISITHDQRLVGSLNEAHLYEELVRDIYCASLPATDFEPFVRDLRRVTGGREVPSSLRVHRGLHYRIGSDESLGIYPVGSFVRLKSGRLGVVTEQNAGTLLAPRVRAFHSVVTNAPIPPILIDLADPGCKDGIVSREHLADWPVGDINRYWAGDLAAMVRGSHS